MFVKKSTFRTDLRIHYCQAQPQFQLSWAELALFSIPPAARISSKLAGNQFIFHCNNGRSNLVEFKSMFKIWERWKATSREVEDDF